MMADLYRHFDASGQLLYVGFSLRGHERQEKHRKQAPWWDRVARIEIQKFQTEAEARAAERLEIAAHRPLMNRAGRQPYTLDWSAWGARHPSFWHNDDPRWEPVAALIWCGHIAAAGCIDAPL